MRKVTRLCILLMVSVVLVFAGFFTACYQPMNPDLDLDVPNSAFDTPFASRATLQEVMQLSGIVDWRIARYFALQTLEGFRQVQEWEGAVLSEYPLGIHCTFTGQPRYYEFRVIRGNTEIGAIVCAAKEIEGSAVLYVLPFATPIDAGIARSIAQNQAILIDSGYPGTLLVRQSGSRLPLYAATGEMTAREYSARLRTIEVLLSLQPEEFEFLGISSQAELDAAIAHQRTVEAQSRNFWQQINESKDEILNLSEEEILKSYRGTENSANSSTIISETVLWAWHQRVNWLRPDMRTKKNIGNCGVYVVYFITLGFGQNSGFPGGVPLHPNINWQQNIFNRFLASIGDGARTFTDMNNRGFMRYTNFRMVYNTLTHNFATIDNHIRQIGFPAISRIRGRTSTFAPWHYRAVIGTLSRRYANNNVSNWYLIHENGAEQWCRFTPAWWETHCEGRFVGHGRVIRW